MDVAAVCAEYGPSKATAVDRHNDHCRWVLAHWLRRKGYVMELQPDGSWVMSVKCEDALGHEVLARAYQGTEDECRDAAESLRRLV